MSTEIDETAILERELAKVGAMGGFVGGFVPGAIGGYLGTKLSAHYLPTETFCVTLQIPVGVEQTLRAAFEILQRAGRITDDASADPSTLRFSAILGSGNLGLNPAVVVVTISAGAENDSIVAIAGAAKEGLIKQRTAEKAVKRVEDMFLETYPSAA